jgi:hypothetical protein
LSKLSKSPKRVDAGVILVKAPFYQLSRAAALFYWPQKDVSNDIVLITGGASGIGKVWR